MLICSSSLIQHCWYTALHFWAVILAAIFFRLRVLGRRHVPRRGGVLIASSHQSYLDPPLIGLSVPRQINYLARDTLFRHSRAFSWVMRSLNAIPVRREGGDMASFRESVRRLEAGRALLLFPEGTRTPDGRIGPIRPGLWNIAHRARVPIVPAVIDGAFKAWPRTRLLPRPRPIRIMFGPPIPLADIDTIGSDGLCALLFERLNDLLRQCQATQAPEDRW